MIMFLLTIVRFMFDGKTTGALECHTGSSRTEEDTDLPPPRKTENGCKSCWKYVSKYGKYGAVKAYNEFVWECNKDVDGCPTSEDDNACMELEHKLMPAALRGTKKITACCCKDKEKCNGGIGVAPMVGCLILALRALKIHGAFL